MTTKPKILLFIDWYLPGYKAGGPVRSCANLVEHLKEDFDFLVVTRDTDYCEDIPYSNVKSNQWNRLDDATRVFYFSKDHLNRKNLKSLIESLDFDRVYINGIYSFKLSILPVLLLRRKKIPIVIAARGMFALSAVRIKKTKKKLFLKAARFTGLYKAVTFHATTPEEKKDIIRQLGDKVTVKVAPNLPRAYKDMQWNSRAKEKGMLKLVHVARIAPEKNLKYALELLSGIKAKIDLDLYGPVYSEHYWNECKTLIAKLPDNVRVNYKGSIESDQLQEQLHNYHFMIMPTKGENFGHIILEALIAGCPVIISDQTPWRDLQAVQAGWDLPLSSPEKFVAVLEQCAAMDNDDYQLYSKASFQFGKAYVEDKKGIVQSKQLFSIA